MYKVENNVDFDVKHNSNVSVPDLSVVTKNHNMQDVDWESQPLSGNIHLGPFSVTYELHIDMSSPIDSSFRVKVSAKVPYFGSVTLINSVIDKDHAEIGFDKYGFKAQVKFDISNLELTVKLGAFGKTWTYVIWKY